MPTHAPDTSFTPHESEIPQSTVVCPAPLTPPSDSSADEYSRRADNQAALGHDDGVSPRPVSDNTAAGMALMQEETMYAIQPALDEKMHTDTGDRLPPAVNPDRDDVTFDDGTDMDRDQDLRTGQLEDSMSVVDGVEYEYEQHSSTEKARCSPSKPRFGEVEPTSGLLSPPLSCSADDRVDVKAGSEIQRGIASIDRELDWSNDELKDWDFSHRRLRPQYPSATFQPYSKFKGTQQSDRQIYNVEVTILTVDIEQSNMSGYLQICGLTPDHPTLTTFFTGEIIGGPDQKYSFRTRDPAWGASDKTDLTHWARFPAWRPLSLHAKRNINFVYPMNHENWWQQEYIFMRWKEHFLVPDYKLKSIQGASFEGFYYICFNQVEGRVSGIYFHSKSEK
jgi:hypothetical protein